VTNIRENKLKGVEIYLVHSFRGFRPWLSGSIVSGLVVRQSIIIERHLIVAGMQKRITGSNIKDAPSDLLLLIRPYLLFSVTSQQCPHTKDH
jgi:hypothetical protein